MNLPHAPVYWIAVQEHFNDLVIATYGRGFWILDDLTPLRQLTPQVLTADAHLFPPRPTYRFREITTPLAPWDDAAVGENPPYGADINYFLRGVPSGNLTITILDQQGQVVRTLTGPKATGVNRVYWDLRLEPTKEVRLRTSPLYAPDVQVGPEGWRPAPAAGRLAILAPPGIYTVQLSVSAKPLTEKLEVRKDPNSAGTDVDIQDQMKVLFSLRRDLDQAADVINQLEVVRSQIYSLARVIDDDAAIRKASQDLDKKLIDLESTFIELRLTGRQDQQRWGAKLVDKLNYLANGLMSADFKPTDQQVEVQKTLEDRLRTHVSELDSLLSRDLAAFNQLLRKGNKTNIIARVPTK